MVNSVKFGAILHPVKLKPGTTDQKDLGPVETEYKSESGAVHGWSYDMYQVESGKNYAREAIFADGDRTAVSHQGAGGRSYAFTGDDGPAIRKVLNDSTELKQADDEIKALEEALGKAQERREQLSQGLVQGYIDQHTGRVEEVVYKFGYESEPRKEPLPPKPFAFPQPKKSWMPNWLKAFLGKG